MSYFNFKKITVSKPCFRICYVAVLLAITLTTACASIAQEAEEHKFHKWLIGFNVEAEQAGISSKTLYHFMKEVEYVPKAIDLDRKQPSAVKTFGQYQNSVMPASRIKRAREQYAQNRKLLHEIGNKYGVQPRFIVALWGLESDFGRNMGSFSVLNSLATLAFEGRRAEFFTKELINALKIIDQEHIPTSKLKGSWAGAMGQTQFMPSSFLGLAVDYDKDGKKDIWGTKADIFASIANYLSKAGWDSGVTWGREVKLPKGFDNKLLGKDTEKTLNEWQNLGIKNINGTNLPSKKGLVASIVKVENKDNSRAFLIYQNYKIVLKWNRSLYFATTVGMLADEIGN